MFPFRGDPLGELEREFNRLSEAFNRGFGLRGTTGGPLMNLWADDNNVYAELDLPAVNPDKVEVLVTEGNQLTVQGERAAPEVPGAVWVRQERPVGRFTRQVTLPVLVDPDKVEARYEHGVLKLTLPKSEAAKPRKITVQS
jgi:HSP20 family protein